MIAITVKIVKKISCFFIAMNYIIKTTRQKPHIKKPSLKEQLYVHHSFPQKNQHSDHGAENVGTGSDLCR